MDYTLKVKKKSDTTFSEVDLFPDTIIDFDLDFYNVDNIDKIKVPISVALTLPLTDSNASSIDYDPRENILTTIPTNPFDFELSMNGSIVLKGNLYVESYEFNNSTPVINTRLVDRIQELFALAKEKSFSQLYDDTDSLISFSQFLSNYSGQFDTTPTGDVIFPYIDFCNDGSKYQYAARQFIQFGFDKERAGLVPALNVKSFINRFFTEAGSSVNSRFFELGNYGTGIPGNNPDDLYVLVPTSLKAGSRTRTRGLILYEGPYEYFVNEFTEDADPSVTKAAESGSSHVQTYGWNYAPTPDANEVDSGYGRSYRTNLPNDGQNIDRAYFGSHMSYTARPVATAQSVTARKGYEMSMVKTGSGEYSMVWRIFPSTSTAVFNINAVIWKDGTPFERLRMCNTDGSIKELNVSDATIDDMRTSTVGYFGVYNNQFGAIDQIATTMSGGFENVMYFNDADIGDFIWEQKDVDIDAGSTYAVTMEFEWLSGEIDVRTVDTWAQGTSSQLVPATFVDRTIKSDKVIKGAYWEAASAPAELYVALQSRGDHNPYFLDDDINIYWMFDDIETLTPFDLMKEIIARFNLSAVYDQNTDSVLIDRLPDIREQNTLVDITDRVDDRNSIKVDIVNQLAKSIEISTSSDGLFFDGEGYGSLTLNPAGSDDLKFSLSSRAYNNSLCGDETFIEIPEGFNEFEIGFTENQFTKYNEIGFVFCYVETPSYNSNIKRARFANKNGYKGLIYETLTGHIFPRIVSEKPNALPLTYFDSVGDTTDLYDFFVGNDNVSFYSKQKVSFSVLFDDDYAFNIKDNYSEVSMFMVPQGNLVIKSLSGKIYQGGIYGDIEAIIL